MHVIILVHLSKQMEFTTLRVKPKINYRLWMIMIQDRSTGYLTNVPLWCRMLIVGEILCVWGQVVYGNSLYILLKFVMNLKLL